MSNNAVFCISNSNKTVRLTVYRCKPNVFLTQLEKLLAAIKNSGSKLEIDELVMSLIENGFDLDAESNGSFTAQDMSTNTLVNWAWLLDLNNNTLHYWDVTAALNGIEETIVQDSISPLDFANWISNDAAIDYQLLVNELQIKLKKIGVSLVNF